MRISGVLLAIALSVGLSVKADAAPLLYQESIDGPLSASNPLVMGAGTNVVTGTGCWSFASIDCNTLSNFAFEIPENMQLTGYRYIIGDVYKTYWHIFPNWSGLVTLLNIDQPGMRMSNSGNWLLGEEQTLTVNLNTPMGSGDYHQFITGSRTGVFGSWDYRIELDVVSTLAEIPLPATALFFGLGLGIVGMTRRRIGQVKA